MVRSEERIERDRASALDLLMAVQGEAEKKNIAIDKKLIADVFFRLGTGPVGEILKNYVNYGGLARFPGTVFPSHTPASR